MSFRANWICRGAPVVRIVPNDALVMSAVGAPKFVWLSRLKNSDRNCKAMPSRAGILKLLFTPRSHCQRFGPRKAFLPRLPNGALALGSANAALFQYCSLVKAPAGGVGSPTRFGRCMATPRHSANRPVASFAEAGV